MGNMERFPSPERTITEVQNMENAGAKKAEEKFFSETTTKEEDQNLDKRAAA